MGKSHLPVGPQFTAKSLKNHTREDAKQINRAESSSEELRSTVAAGKIPLRPGWKHPRSSPLRNTQMDPKRRNHAEGETAAP